MAIKCRPTPHRLVGGKGNRYDVHTDEDLDREVLTSLTDTR